MAITCPDLHLYAQGVLYLVIFLVGFPVAVPLLVTFFNFRNRCMFYAEFTVIDRNKVSYTVSNSTTCTYPIVISVVCLLYGLAMTVWYCKAIARRGPDAGSQMLTLLPVLVNCAFSVTIFISSCIISVGFKTLCDRLVEARHGESCVKGETMIWTYNGSHVNGESYYSCFKVAEIASWTCFLALAAQAVLGMLRLYRNHRMSSRQATDMNNFASAEPTA